MAKKNAALSIAPLQWRRAEDMNGRLWGDFFNFFQLFLGGPRLHLLNIAADQFTFLPSLVQFLNLNLVLRVQAEAIRQLSNLSPLSIMNTKSLFSLLSFKGSRLNFNLQLLRPWPAVLRRACNCSLYNHLPPANTPVLLAFPPLVKGVPLRPPLRLQPALESVPTRYPSPPQPQSSPL